MLFLDMDLPQGALLTPQETTTVDWQGAIHFSASSGLDVEGESVLSWTDVTGIHKARPAAPNNGNSKRDSLHGVDVLRLTDAVNCGFVLEGLNLDRPLFSAAALFASPTNRAGTLFTLNGQDDRNYLFVKETDQVASLKYRDEAGDISQPTLVASDRFQLVIASASGTSLNFVVNDQPHQSMTTESVIVTGQSDLFIGCRSDRSGITKTLGELRLADLWVWPNVDVFETPDLIAALQSKWRSGDAHGL